MQHRAEVSYLGCLILIGLVFLAIVLFNIAPEVAAWLEDGMRRCS